MPEGYTLTAASRVFLAGHRGLVGSALLRRLRAGGVRNIITRSRAELDLTDQRAVEEFFTAERPEVVILAAAKVGGIMANTVRPADFIRENLLIQTNVIDAAQRHGVERFIFLGSSCIYPKLAPQPIREEHLLTGPLEPTNEPYAVAKIAGVRMCQAYRRQHNFNAACLMPTNLYGPGDNFDPETSHVLPALVRRFHEAKGSGAGEVVIWGSGEPRREFLHVDDLADACVFLLEMSDAEFVAGAPDSLVNIGVGEDLSIRELAELVRDVVGVDCRLTFDRSKPDGTPRKLLDVSRMKRIGWSATTTLQDGVAATYRWFREQSVEAEA